LYLKKRRILQCFNCFSSHWRKISKCKWCSKTATKLLVFLEYFSCLFHLYSQ